MDAPTVSVPDLRDYHLINAEVDALLDAGHRRVRLAGAERQRLLLSRLAGRWRALVEVDGVVGPEFAAELDAPGLTVVCRGPAADGLARGLRAGLVVVLGDAGAGCGYGLRGGTLVVSGASGPRAGLNQAGGAIALLGPAGPLAGERQSGGRIVLPGPPPPHAGRGGRGGVLIATGPAGPEPGHPALTDLAAIAAWVAAGCPPDQAPAPPEPA